MNVSPRRRVLLLFVFAALGLLAAACGGLNESQWRRELEPLLPDGMSIVDSRTGDCVFNQNCTVGFVLEHDRARYAEDVAAFETAMVSKGWPKVGEHNNVDAAGARFDRKGVRVTLKLLSPSWHKRCVESRGADSADCQSTLLVEQR
jgi:hypothetical protein